jgi:hypothetical protein
VNPYETPESPRCIECDEQMVIDDRVMFWRDERERYVCDNVECEACSERIRKQYEQPIQSK